MKSFSVSEQTVTSSVIQQATGSLNDPLRRPGLKANWLACFIEVTRKGQIAAAARALGITGQALRRNLSQLEEHLGVQLLEQQDKLVQLTPSGEGFLLDAFELFHALRRLNRGEAPQTRPDMDTLKLGWSRSWLQQILTGLCVQVREILPRHKLSLSHLPSPRELEQALLEEQLDLILSWSAPSSSSIACLSGLPSPFVIVSAPQPARHWDEFSYALPESELSAAGQPISDFRPSRVLIESGHYYTLLEAALSGLCAVYLPECMVRSQLEQRQLAVVAEPPIKKRLTPYVCWRAESHRPDLAGLGSQLRSRGFR